MNLINLYIKFYLVKLSYLRYTNIKVACAHHYSARACKVSFDFWGCEYIVVKVEYDSSMTICI